MHICIISKFNNLTFQNAKIENDSKNSGKNEKK